MAVSDSLGTRRQVTLPSGTVHYREHGEGDPIVFVHGVLVNADIWRDVVPPLAVRHRCIAPDWPFGSHEHAMAPDADLSPPGLARLVADFLAALDLENVTLVGNDTGGAICQLVATRHPERVGRLVLASCDGFEIFPPPAFKFLAWLGRLPGALATVAQALRVRALRRTPLAYGWVMREHPEASISDSYTRPALRGDIRRDARKVLAGVSSAHTLEAARHFGEFERPVLVAWAEHDRLFPQELGDRLAAAFPNSRRAVVHGSRTFVGEDEPEQLAKLIEEFVGASEGRRQKAAPAAS